MLLVTAGVPAFASATVVSPPLKEVRFQVLGWSLSCLGESPSYVQCQAARNVGRARVTFLFNAREALITLRGGCPGRPPERVARISLPVLRYDGQFTHELDRLFMAQFEGCRSPLSWRWLQPAGEVASIMSQLVRH
jgi:hypothetical protein